jgi:glutamyl-tRNA reductase
MQRLLILGLNHTTAPIDVRERLAFDPQQRSAALRSFRDTFPDAEAVLLSTCNRVEIYTSRPVQGRPRANELASFIGERHQVEPEKFESHLYEKSQRDAVEHLFTVVTSLDSMVLGETQILGQVRDAYDAARDAGAAGAVLNPLFQRAIAVGKEVMRDTPLSEGRASVASVAVEYARQIFDRFDDKTVLCIGAGKMTGLTLRHFAALRPKAVLLANRDATKADALAARFGGVGVAFDSLEQSLASADIVISSTGSPRPILGRDQFARALKRRRYRPIFVIDIALPRDIDPSVGELEHIYLYNLDDLQKVVARTMSQRHDSIESARRIVARHVDEFLVWQRQRELGPAIDRLYQRMHEMAREELERTIGKLSGMNNGDRAHLEELSRRIVNKLLHEPIDAMRRADELHGPAQQYLHALEKLFGLTDAQNTDPTRQDPHAHD